ncbi:MAG: M67 family metallopeptidase, partial [Mycolicibacterium sp.]|nr:M67 family metallopeptidase [Mycolicibacterium sp.]
MRRSFVGTAVVATLFGGQALVGLAVTGQQTALTVLLFTSLGVAITINVLADPLAVVLDRLAFSGSPDLRADRDAEDRGLAIVGVMHSHTHTEAYPSPTDVTQAPDPDWHYVIVSLRQPEPVLRSYRIVDGNIDEESV